MFVYKTLKHDRQEKDLDSTRIKNSHRYILISPCVFLICVDTLSCFIYKIIKLVSIRKI